MSSPNDNYQAVLEDLERQRADLTTAINTLRRVMGLPPVGDEPVAIGTSRGSSSLRSDEFFNMSILDAAKRYLSVVKQPTTAPEIAKALKDHGLINDSPKFPATVYNILFREEKRGKGTVIQSTGKRWGLADWYPNRKKTRAGASQNGEHAQSTADDEADGIDEAEERDD